FLFFFQAEDGIRDFHVTGVQTCALPISGMISGGAGATVVVLIALSNMYGVEYLFAAVALAGLLQFLVGAFKLGKFVRLIPQPVRSEERRVGKECRSRCARCHRKK